MYHVRMIRSAVRMFVAATLAALFIGGCNSNGEGQHGDGFGNSWTSSEPTGVHTFEGAQSACATYRNAVARQFAWVPDASVEDQANEKDLKYVCAEQQDTDGNVTGVCTLLSLQEAPSLNIIVRKVCWMLDGTITVNDAAYHNTWY